MKRATLLSFVMVSGLIGLWLSKYGIEFGGEVLALVFLLAFIVRKKPRILLLMACLLFMQLGLMRGSQFNETLQPYRDNFDQVVEINGRVMDDPRYGFRGQTEFAINNVVIDGNSASGEVRVRTHGAIGLQRGDSISVVGKLRSGYGSKQGSISYGKLSIVSRSSSPIEKIRRQYFSGVYSAISDPQASLGLGFLVGLRALLPDDLMDQLSTTGLTHIVAVSGYNLTVIIGISKRWLHRFSRFIALAMSFGLMGLFIAVTGGAPSIVRASVVAALSLIAWYFGRKVHPLVLLLFSAIVTAFYNPIYLWSDIGWWLSFLAFYGVLILAPMIQLRFIKRELKMIGRTLLETICAQVMALPLIVAIFGELSLISILANLLILPLIPLAMLLTFIAGSAGAVAPEYAGWVAWPAEKLLTGMTSTIDVMSKISGALINVDLSVSSMLGIYSMIIIFSWLALRTIGNRRLEDVSNMLD